MKAGSVGQAAAGVRVQGGRRTAGTEAKARTVKNVTVAAGMIDENGPGETGPVIMIVALAAMAEIVAEGAMTVTVEEGGTTAGAGATALAPSGPAAGRAAIGEECLGRQPLVSRKANEPRAQNR
ncbi:unnamed protein product [Effrenium voratum]|nr:unnamed protein product [Effrenium voratum]